MVFFKFPFCSKPGPTAIPFCSVFAKSLCALSDTEVKRHH